MGVGQDVNYEAVAAARKVQLSKHARERIKYTKITCGCYHTVLTCSNGEAYSFGAGGFGKLGHGTEEDERVPRVVTNWTGKEGNPVLDDDQRIVQIAAFVEHTVFVTAEGQVYTCGEGSSGRHHPHFYLTSLPQYFRNFPIAQFAIWHESSFGGLDNCLFSPAGGPSI